MRPLLKRAFLFRAVFKHDGLGHTDLRETYIKTQ